MKWNWKREDIIVVEYNHIPETRDTIRGKSRQAELPVLSFGAGKVGISVGIGYKSETNWEPY